jgi:hypothetical protein
VKIGRYLYTSRKLLAHPSSNGCSGTDVDPARRVMTTRGDGAQSERSGHSTHPRSSVSISSFSIDQNSNEASYSPSFGDPYDRAVSAHHYLRRARGGFISMLQRSGPWQSRRAHPEPPRYVGDHIRRQEEYLTIDGESVVDQVGGFENLRDM